MDNASDDWDAERIERVYQRRKEDRKEGRKEEGMYSFQELAIGGIFILFCSRLVISRGKN